MYYFVNDVDNLNNDVSMFKLNVIFGVIRIFCYFDYEFKKLYIFEVFVRDKFEEG